MFDMSTQTVWYIYIIYIYCVKVAQLLVRAPTKRCAK